MATKLAAIRAEALFASTMQRSQQPDAAQVRAAVTATLRRYGTRGCAAHVAGEFGDHPETAAGRMTWALAMVDAVYSPQPAAALRFEAA
jgi:hypothetical protein